MSTSLATAIATSLTQAQQAVTHFGDDQAHVALISTLCQHFARAINDGNKLMICGNGGSACDAMHFAEELTGRYRRNRRALPAIALADASHITCVGNDFGFDAIFARSVEAYAKPNDWLIVMSTSGHSANIVQAVQQAQRMAVKTVALLGKDGGVLRGQCDYEFIVPQHTSDRIQEIHMMVLHIMVEGIERLLFPELYE